MKVIFLDVDGVLNTEDTFDFQKKKFNQTGVHYVEIDEFRVKHLGDIVKETGAMIVLHSAWKDLFDCDNGFVAPRNFEAKYLLNLFDKYNITLYDVTPTLFDYLKQDEINIWLLKHKEVTDYIVIDDESIDLMDFVNINKLIKTSTTPIGKKATSTRDWTGLCAEHIRQAIDILNENEYQLMGKRSK